jgi:hypothetical protein
MEAAGHEAGTMQVDHEERESDERRDVDHDAVRGLRANAGRVPVR